VACAALASSLGWRLQCSLAAYAPEDARLRGVGNCQLANLFAFCLYPADGLAPLEKPAWDYSEEGGEKRGG